MNKRSFRIECAVEQMKRMRPGCDLHFLTLTTPDVCTPDQVASRWRLLVNSDYWRKLKMQYVQVVEWHPGGHGYHIHVVVDKYLFIRKFRPYAQRFGFGRIHILKCDQSKVSKMAYYLGKYLTKYRDESKGGRRTRFCNVSRGLTTLSDIGCASPEIEYVRKGMQYLRDNPGASTASPFRMMQGFAHMYYTSAKYADRDYLAEMGISYPDERVLRKFDYRYRRENNLEFAATHCVEMCYTCRNPEMEHKVKFTSHVLCDKPNK